MTLCRLCSQNSNLVRSHIIPNAFFRVLNTGSEVPLLVTNIVGEYPKSSPTGVYDRTILCESCEAKFTKIDDYGIDVLLKNFDKHFEPIIDNSNPIGFSGKEVKPEMLLRFLVATAWRASVSSQQFYKNVYLDKFESTAAEVIKFPNRPISQAFDAVLSRWAIPEGSEDFTEILMNPFSEDWDGVMYYRFYFGRIVAYLKVSDLPFPEHFLLALTRQDSVIITMRNLDKSKDFLSLRRTVEGSKRSRPFKREN